jgi:hypothetical protein
VVTSGTAGTFAGNSVNGAESTDSTATCSGATPKLISGGAIITQGANGQAAISRSAPTPQTGTPTGWTARAVLVANNGSNGNRPTILAYAVCAPS